ncbi:gamma-glutamylcyclotransferase family protein [Cohnella yongneupensis]|uniref:Gamma-glutamylcyclotransferase n=1 Tax=Cohnella yongneupensis TaxID=425006 RepID=A0ABW0QUF6_9BACL
MRLEKGHVRIFVYGSLLPGLHNHGVISPYVISILEGRVRGRLVDYGPYPALMPDSECTVRGMWMEVSLAAMPGLDELEGFKGIEEDNDYERVWARDIDDPTLAGWLYIWTDSRGYPVIESDWWPDVARTKLIEP